MWRVALQARRAIATKVAAHLATKRLVAKRAAGGGASGARTQTERELNYRRGPPSFRKASRLGDQSRDAATRLGAVRDATGFTIRLVAALLADTRCSWSFSARWEYSLYISRSRHILPVATQR